LPVPDIEPLIVPVAFTVQFPVPERVSVMFVTKKLPASTWPVPIEVSVMVVADPESTIFPVPMFWIERVGDALSPWPVILPVPKDSMLEMRGADTVISIDLLGLIEIPDWTPRYKMLPEIVAVRYC
jgi:hypothetical protein